VDELQHSLQIYRARPTAPALWKLDVLMDLEVLRDPRVVPFLLAVLLDGGEPLDVRIRVVRYLREPGRVAEARPSAADALIRAVADRSNPELRLAAVLALTDFTDVAGVSSVLGAVAGDGDEPMDVRYSALTALEHAVPSSELTALMRHVSTDQLLGCAARTLLAHWERG
jgi:HEAT repeat protein